MDVFNTLVKAESNNIFISHQSEKNSQKDSLDSSIVYIYAIGNEFFYINKIEKPAAYNN